MVCQGMEKRCPVRRHLQNLNVFFNKVLSGVERSSESGFPRWGLSMQPVLACLITDVLSLGGIDSLSRKDRTWVTAGFSQVELCGLC